MRTLVCLALLGAVAAADTAGSEKKYQARLKKLAADDAEGHYKLGRWCLRRRLSQRAKQRFEAVLALDPDHAGARAQLGFVRHDGRWVTREEKAAAELEARRAAVDASDAGALFQLAEWARRKRLYDQAEALYRKVLELDGTHARARAALGKATRSAVGRHIAAYVAGEREKSLKALRRKDRIRPDEVGTIVLAVRTELRKLPRHDGAKVTKLTHPRFPIRYRLMGKTKGKDLSLLVLLHSGGPSTRINDMTWTNLRRFGRGTPFDLVATPRVWDDTTGAGWTYEAGPVAVDAMIREIVRAYDVDTNRVYLNGYSMGGYGTSYIGALEADRFGALGVCAAGRSGSESIPNMLHTPIAIHIGAQDHASDHIGTSRELKRLLDAAREAVPGGYRVFYKEYPTGHQLPPSVQDGSLTWMAQFVRDPAPKHVVWEPFTSERYPTHKYYFYWLKIATPRRGMRIEAFVLDNKIEIETKQVRRFTVFLNDRLVDLARPVTIKVNGRMAYKGKPAPSLTAIVESYVAKEDPEMIFTRRIDLK